MYAREVCVCVCVCVSVSHLFCMHSFSLAYGLIRHRHMSDSGNGSTKSPRTAEGASAIHSIATVVGQPSANKMAISPKGTEEIGCILYSVRISIH